MTTPVDSTAELDYSQLVPGVTIECRDERWLITKVDRVSDGWRLRVRGLTDFVRDTTATFFTALEGEGGIRVFDPAKVEVVPDNSEHFRNARVWLETTLRSIPVPLYYPELSVAPEMLADPLQYQLDAVKQALSDEHIRPRILLADAVGLGKTLEIGMILSELIRRGRGERILVVTPKSVLSQFQQEMWTRFAIPLVSLDSQGIQKVRQKLPASKNPFTFFPRVIVSMDTLKQVKYRAQLQKVNWDAIVIDEIHNATNVGSQNNDLVRVLAPRTESLILASATPHNGDPAAFKEILRFLDPLAVLPNGKIDTEVAKKLIIRRHRNSPEVSEVVDKQWAQRKEPLNIAIEPSPEERAVEQELSATWMVKPPTEERLFQWTLVKAFLSSPKALSQTIENRRGTIAKRKGAEEEIAALDRLLELNSRVVPETSNKFNELVTYLESTLGVGKKSDRRVVIFSERVGTLTWLAEHLQAHFGFKKGGIQILHGSLSEQEQNEIVDSFKRRNSPVRILITGDVASEGVNLHAQCHDLIHYDIPWSLICIQQRNGRVDRYGQEHEPQITTMLLDFGENSKIGDLHVLVKLMQREHEAHKFLGDAGRLMGKYTIKAEEDLVRDVLARQRIFDDEVGDPEAIAHGKHAIRGAADDSDSDQSSLDFLLNQDAWDDIDLDEEPEKTLTINHVHQSLYKSEQSYLEDSLDVGFLNVKSDPLQKNGVGYRDYEDGIVELTPPKDLQRHLDFLPQDYVEYRKVKETLKLATSKPTGNRELVQAREGDENQSWPAAHFLGPLHPVSAWAADRALSRMPLNHIHAVSGNVFAPTILLAGTLTNDHGQVVSRVFTEVSQAIPNSAMSVPDAYQWLKEVGLKEDAISAGGLEIPAGMQEFLVQAVRTTESSLEMVFDAKLKEAQGRVDRWNEIKTNWDEKGQGMRAIVKTEEEIETARRILASSTPTRHLVRPLVVVLPAQSAN